MPQQVGWQGLASQAGQGVESGRTLEDRSPHRVWAGLGRGGALKIQLLFPLPCLQQELQEEAATVSPEGRCVVGGGHRTLMILAGWGCLGTRALSPSPSIPTVPTPLHLSHPQAKAIVCILGPHYQSLVMRFRGPRGIAAGSRDSSRPVETPLPVSPSCHSRWERSSLDYHLGRVWLKCSISE